MKVLEKLAAYQTENPGRILVVALLLTVLLSTGIPSIQLQTDFQEGLPDSLPPLQAQDEIEAKFGSSDSIIVLFQVNEEPKQDSFVTDVRDPRMVEMQSFLASELEKESMVRSTQSLASFFPGELPENRRLVEQRLAAQGSMRLVNRDYTSTLMLVQLSEEMSEENIKEADRIISENLEETPKYPGVDITVTGLPVIRTDLSDVLVSDSGTTIAAASLLILGLLVMTRGRVYGPITFIPLFAGLLWTLGAMGLFGIPLTIATIALGAMILGLGVEYGSFMTERILEEMETSSVEEAVKTAVPTTGKAILGSSTTTIVGFSALLIASISFIRDLGLTLALGISLTLTAALVITPALIVQYRRWTT